MKNIRALALAISFSLSASAASWAKQIEPIKLSWQNPPVLAPTTDASQIDFNTPFLLNDASNICWNSGFFAMRRPKADYSKTILTGIDQTDLKGLSPRQISDLLVKSPDSTTLNLQSVDGNALPRFTLGELRQLIRQRPPGGEPAMSIKVETINRAEDYNFASLKFDYANNLAADAALLHDYATNPHKDGDAPPLDFDCMQIDRALRFADDFGYFHLSDELIEKAIKISQQPLGDYPANGFWQVINAARYLAKTGRLEAADKMYRNLLKTAYNWGVQPLFCSQVMLDYANFLKYQGKAKEAEPIFKELEFRVEGDKPADLCYGMAGSQKGDSFPLRWNFCFFQEHHFWPPAPNNEDEIAPESADKSSPLNAPGRIIYTNNVGHDQDWQKAYQAYINIEEHKWIEADSSVQGILAAESGKYTHNLKDIGRLTNLANAYHWAGETTKANRLRLAILPLTAEPRQATNRALLIFELAYDHRDEAILGDHYWHLFEATAHDASDHFPDLSAQRDNPEPPPAPTEKQREEKIINMLSALADYYLVYDQPSKAIFIREQAIKRHSTTPQQKISFELKLATLFARLKQFDKAAAIIRPMICDTKLMEMCGNNNLADAISQIRMAGNLHLAKELAESAISKGSTHGEPISFQLGLVNLQEKDFARAEKNFKRDLADTEIFNGYKINIVPALIRSELAQGKYSDAFDDLINASKLNFVRHNTRTLLIMVLPHLDKITEDQLSAFFLAMAQDRGPISELGHASQLQELKKIAEARPDWPPAFAQAVRDWSVNYYPEAKRPTTSSSSATASNPTVDQPTSDPWLLIQTAQVEFGLGNVDKAVANILLALKNGPDGNFVSDERLLLPELRELGRLADIEKIRNALVDNSRGIEHERFLAKLAAFYIEQKKNSEAESCIAEGMRNLIVLPDPLQLGETVYPWFETAQIYTEQKEYAKALTIISGIEKAQKEWLGPMNSQCIQTLLAKAELEQLMANNQLALEDARAALRIKRVTGDLASYATERERLSKLYGEDLDTQWTEQDAKEVALIVEQQKNSRWPWPRQNIQLPQDQADRGLIEKISSGKFGASVQSEYLERSAEIAVKEGNLAQASENLKRALALTEQDEGKTNVRRSVLMAQLAGVAALEGKKLQAKEWRLKARQAVSKKDSAETRLQTAAYDACSSALIGDKESTRVKALEVLRAGRLDKWEFYCRPVLKP